MTPAEGPRVSQVLCVAVKDKSEPEGFSGTAGLSNMGIAGGEVMEAEHPAGWGGGEEQLGLFWQGAQRRLLFKCPGEMT